ncbi:MAG: hypothetical protein A2744_03045 [Candidatus Buchananbacteria bacterium RIFCSPHIGHO2_01_FULL_44_11]|uniref:Uncharacterized protein n=1 Tax=Candidatus Buchananbacteria bacterium RIFCSPHIGHO2_01_FULL_44_11 TaxID=1797535 RepID=A0A1G1Y021_9BACT|nr:MAG: hypothetical protein A2744_03045 [Candidatus Buchananbacteria bacterium RIFCSPHIGHO2_01_FULL_44_11]
MATTTLATTTLMDLVNSFSDKTADLADQVTAQAQAGGSDIWFTFLGLDWSKPTWDLVILLFFVISVLIYSFTLGRDRIVAILISTYLSLAVATNLPYADKLNELISRTGGFAFQTAAFLAAFILLFVFLSRSSLIQSLSNLGGSFWQVILFSLLQVGLLTSVILSFLPPAALDQLSFFTKIVFLSELGRFCWVVLPILALVFVRGRQLT